MLAKQFTVDWSRWALIELFDLFSNFYSSRRFAWDSSSFIDSESYTVCYSFISTGWLLYSKFVTLNALLKELLNLNKHWYVPKRWLALFSRIGSLLPCSCFAIIFPWNLYHKLSSFPFCVYTLLNCLIKMLITVFFAFTLAQIEHGQVG